uniref:Lipoxygenase domain-containing protein n=1 Tax=Ciona intestinalis TaxID=7719 RepID=F6UJG6_CIOIN
METYKLIITTNDRYLGAGTDATVCVKITGVTGNDTKWTDLDHFFQDDFERGKAELYTVEHEGDTVGEPVVVQLKLTGILESDGWLCDDVIVEYNGHRYEFPVFDWIEGGEVAVTRGEATLPQNVTHPQCRELRSKEVENNLKKFEWQPPAVSDKELSWGVNRYMKAAHYFELPSILRRTQGKLESMAGSGLTVALNAGKNLFNNLFSNLKTLDDYRELYKKLKYESKLHFFSWKTDKEFGRQVLTGISPLAFERCTKIPNGCDVTNEHVCGLLAEGKTLESEIKAGKIYIADYSHTYDVERNDIPGSNKKFVCADCRAIFYVNPQGDFLPIAIQLCPNDEETVHTPLGNEHDWLLAKMYFRASVRSTHEWIYHYLQTHAASETFCIAMFRNLPRNHPMYKLLRQHVRTAPAINTDARVLLVPNGSLANKSNHLSKLNAPSSVRKSYKTFNLNQLDIPACLKRKGLDDPNLLPNFHYRDDALDVWKAMEQYVANVVNHHYTCDKDIKEDYELQSFMFDVAHEGFGWQDNDLRGFPDKLNTRYELIHMATIIIFASSAQHAAVNFGQMETYRFIPNAPGSMILPPHKRGEADEQRVMDSLPGVVVSSILISFSFALSEYAKDELFLGDVPDRLFTDPKVIEMQVNFKQELSKLQTKFEERNKKLKYAYTYLLPDKIPISIAI